MNMMASPKVSVCQVSAVGTQPRPLPSLWSAAFVPQQQSGVVVTETLWPAEPGTLTIWPFTENAPSLL